MPILLVIDTNLARLSSATVLGAVLSSILLCSSSRPLATMVRTSASIKLSWPSNVITTFRSFWASTFGKFAAFSFISSTLALSLVSQSFFATASASNASRKALMTSSLQRGSPGSIAAPSVPHGEVGAGSGMTGMISTMFSLTETWFPGMTSTMSSLKSPDAEEQAGGGSRKKPGCTLPSFASCSSFGPCFSAMCISSCPPCSIALNSLRKWSAKGSLI
mmetsp:Transcript_116855/g.377126  ORF Transcript_116855/g.377126 Transcript_116855/m.377126 type:complete len:219 (+) Transcript_116855:106-762(+)